VFLAGAWRAAPPPLPLAAAEAADLVPALLAGGAGGLGGWRLQATSSATDPEFSALFQAFRAYTLEAAVRERQLVEAVGILRHAGIETLLGKGWAAARHYARPALRPYGDIDLFLPAVEKPRALVALQNAARPLPIDLHAGFAELEDRSEESLFARSVMVDVLGVPVRVLGPEDHLRLVALHLLRHGGTRPIWLTDIAAMVEAGRDSLDWDLVLAGKAQSARAVACVTGLAVRWLGAGSPEASALRAAEFDRPPAWLEGDLLEQWGRGSEFRLPLADEAWRPGRFLRELIRHWPNAIEASAGIGAPFDDGPRWPCQLAFVAVRAARFARTRGRFDR
jgi:hypothetical protein